MICTGVFHRYYSRILSRYNKEKAKNPLKSLLISEDFMKVVRVTGFEPAA